MFDRLDELASEGWEFLAIWFLLGLLGCYCAFAVVACVMFSPLLLVLAGIGWCREKYWQRKDARINMEG